MRLGTCIALELVIAAGAVGGVWLGVGEAVRLAADHLGTHEAIAATSHAPMAVPVRLPRATLEVAPPQVVVSRSVFGASDEALLAPLGTSPVTRIKLNHGGTSLSIRVDFASGARASFKPEQIHPQSNPRREIAAYRIDRLLGLGRVPPAKAVQFELAALLEAAEPSHRRFLTERFANEAIVRGGVVRGELSWWIPELKFAKVGPHLLEEDAGQALWSSYLQVGATVPEAARPLAEQIASLVLFDVLIDNPDRWTGGNTVMSPDATVLYFMDNTMSFSRFAVGHKSNLKAMRRIQVFSRRLVDRLRTLTEDDVVAALGTGDEAGLAPLIDERDIRALLKRRNGIVRFIDELIAQHGEAAVLALP